MIGAAFRSIFGDTKSPEVTLFKTLKTSWNSLDLDSFVLPEIPSSYQKEKDKLLFFINSLLSPEEVKKLPRCDYKELLELSKVTLGESIERKKGYLYSLVSTSCRDLGLITTLKMSLLRHQLDLHWQTKKKVEKMSLFVIFVYLKSWFGAPSLTAAATEDLELYSRLHKFRTVHSKVSSTTTSVLQRHTSHVISYRGADPTLSLQ